MTAPDDPDGESGLGFVGAVDVEAGPMAVGLLVGVGGLLFLLEPLVDPVRIGQARVRLVALSTVVLAGGFCLGAVVFLRRDRRLFGLAHGVFGLAWAGIAAGTAFGNGTLVVAAVLLVVAGAGTLVSRGRR